MEASGTGAAAMLVGTSEDVEGRLDTATLTLPREEIEEALASDAPLDLILSVQSGEGGPKDVRVAWQRNDLEAILGRVEAGPVTLSFDRAELYRAFEHPDFEGHGMREIVLLVAAASSSAALMASTASGQVLDAGGGGGSGAVGAAVMPGHDEARTASDLAASGVVVPGHDEASTASALATSAAAHDELGAQARGIGQTVPNNDEATLIARGIDPAIATAIGTGDATTARDLATPAVHDELGAQARGIGQSIPGNDEATLIERGIDPAIATAIGTGDATTARDLATPAVHDELGAQARGIGQSIPGNDEATLIERGIDPAIATAIGTGDATTARDLATPATPATPAPSSGSSFDVPSLDAGTAAVVGGLAGASLLILGGAFAVRRQRVTPV